jgi:hypothetical protein
VIACGHVQVRLNALMAKCAQKFADAKETLAVADSKLGSAIKDKFGIACVNDSATNELLRCIRFQFINLVGGAFCDSVSCSCLLVCLPARLSVCRLSFMASDGAGGYNRRHPTRADDRREALSLRQRLLLLMHPLFCHYL